MNRVQIAVLGATLVAFGGAYVLFNSGPPAPQQKVVVQQPKLDVDDVLIAAKDIPMGATIGDDAVAWQAWPKSAVSELMIAKSSGPNVMDDVKGARARDAFLRGEPMRRDKLVKGAAGFMSAILPTGMRAVAIKVDNGGDNYAGGFILPNDRVDVVSIYRDDQATKERGVEVVGVRTILSNVKVLAIGQNIQEDNGKKTVTSSNATLELDPQQAEQVILAQGPNSSNLLHLVLRSLADSAGPAETPTDDAQLGAGLTVVRFGSPQTAAR